MKKFEKSLIMGRRKKKVRGDRQWGGRVYAGRRTDAGGYLAFFSVAGARNQRFLNKIYFSLDFYLIYIYYLSKFK